MKKVEAIVKPFKVDDIKNALNKMGIQGMTVTEVSGRGKQRGVTLQWRVGEYHVDFLPKLKLEVVVLDDDVPKLVNAITTAARTGEAGDGKIFIIPLDNAVRVRTGEDGDRAV